LRTGRAFSVDVLAGILGVEEHTILRDLAVLQGTEHIEIIEESGQGPALLETSVLEPRGIRC
jgi:hypothetical protein